VPLAGEAGGDLKVAATELDCRLQSARSPRPALGLAPKPGSLLVAGRQAWPSGDSDRPLKHPPMLIGRFRFCLPEDTQVASVSEYETET
jgi:hypothetical protein